MMSFTMRTENGTVTVDANDPATGFRRVQEFRNSNEAFDALKEWELEIQSPKPELTQAS